MMKTSQSQISNQVLHLASWPPLSPQWHETAPHVTRICALLARRPSVGLLIPVMLDIPPHTVCSLLEALHADGHIYPSAALADQPGLSTVEAVPPHEPAGCSFLGKLWQRLIDAK
jgi:hypothetical protein